MHAHREQTMHDDNHCHSFPKTDADRKEPSIANCKWSTHWLIENRPIRNLTITKKIVNFKSKSRQQGNIIKTNSTISPVYQIDRTLFKTITGPSTHQTGVTEISQISKKHKHQIHDLIMTTQIRQHCLISSIKQSWVSALGNSPQSQSPQRWSTTSRA